MLPWTEEFEIDENGDRWRLLRSTKGKNKGEIFSRARADEQKAFVLLEQIQEDQRNQKITENTEVSTLLTIDPKTATNEDITRLLQFVVRKLV